MIRPSLSVKLDRSVGNFQWSGGELYPSAGLGYASTWCQAVTLTTSIIQRLENAMAGGWSRDGAVQDQIDASVEDGVQRARSQLVNGESALHCDECDCVIPEARRKAIPGVRLCIACQSALESQETKASGINRRGSKDSQLR
jgi:phage/conjugal plasmid C-4 type zinc finger TraR family protein